MAKKNINNLTNKIPYINCFDNDGCGIIVTAPGVYTHTYIISAPATRNSDLYNADLLHSLIAALYRDIASAGMTYQFCLRNRRIDEKEYLKTILVPHMGDPVMDLNIDAYNQTIMDNVSIGHNNCDAIVYLTLSYQAETEKEAEAAFKKMDEIISADVSHLYGYSASALDLTGRLRSLYDCYHPEGEEEFGTIADYDGKGFSLKSMQQMHLTTKDVIAPNVYDDHADDYIRIGTTYARSLYLVSVPEVLPQYVLSDIISVSSDALLSVQCIPVDSKIVFDAVGKRVKANTTVKLIPVRDTIQDRKTRRTEKKEMPIEETEQAYADKAALDLAMDAVAKGDPLCLSTITIVLYADSLDDLDRDTALLKASCLKYAIQVKVAGRMQTDVYNATLPLCADTINCKRMYSLDQMVMMLPINIRAQYDRRKMMIGLNAINDNLVLTDRTNNIAGIMIGADHMGRAFATKRETLSALMQADNEVIILTDRPDKYETFCAAIGGTTNPAYHPDIFAVDPDYNMTHPTEELKQAVIEAVIASGCAFGKIKRAEEKEEKVRQAEAEAEMLSGFKTYKEAYTYAMDNRPNFPLFCSACYDYTADDYDLDSARLHVIKYQSDRDLILALAGAWNHAICAKKTSGKNVWIYVDGADVLTHTTATSDLALILMDRAKDLKTPITYIMRQAVRIIGDQFAAIELSYILQHADYVRILGVGPIERRYLADKMDIPDMLMPYITDREPGDGIVMTSSGNNVAYTDRLAVGDNNHAFYNLFY